MYKFKGYHYDNPFSMYLLQKSGTAYAVPTFFELCFNKLIMQLVLHLGI